MKVTEIQERMNNDHNSNDNVNHAIDIIYHEIVKLAKEAGLLQKQYFRTKNFEITTKSTEVDMLTEVDLACDHLIVEKLKQLFPNDAILSEEQGNQPLLNSGASGFTWIIDPLDGTTNFSIGHPVFAVSIARWQGESPVFGVVYLPMLNELFYAQVDKGAYMNHERVYGSNRSVLRESVLATGFPYDRATAENNNSENAAILIPMVKGIRRLGAAAYDLCLVAAGVYDAYWELRLGKWDLAAGMLMITEAGGEFTHFEEGGKYNVIAGAPTLCKQIKELVNITNYKR